MPAKTVGARRDALKRQRQRGAGEASPRVQVSEMQRTRLLAAATASIAELGYAHASVAHITSRARVSRRTFYDLFDGREDCLLAVLDDVVQRISHEIAGENLTGLPWRERVRGGLLAILSFFDREPVLARVCVVQALQGGPRVLRRREEVLAKLVEILDEGRAESARSRQCTSLTAEGLVGAAFAIVYARLSQVSTMPPGREGASRSMGREGAHWRTTYASDRGRGPIVRDRPAPPLVALVGELMSLIVLPYLGPAAAEAERRRAVPSVSPAARVTRGRGQSARTAVADDPLAEVPMRLTYRTAMVLEAIARNPGASNRAAGEGAGTHDQGQISKLLARLRRLGLIQNHGGGQAKGEPNAWRLTPLGERVAAQLSLGGRSARAGEPVA